MPHEILESIAAHPNVAWAFDKIAQLSIPASITFTAGSIIKAVRELPSVPHHITATEAVVQIVTAGIYSIATVIGSLGVVLSIYMAGQWRKFRAESDRIKQERDHEFRMAQLRSGEIDRIGKPGEDTVDLK